MNGLGGCLYRPSSPPSLHWRPVSSRQIIFLICLLAWFGSFQSKLTVTTTFSAAGFESFFAPQGQEIGIIWTNGRRRRRPWREKGPRQLPSTRSLSMSAAPRCGHLHAAPPSSSVAIHPSREHKQAMIRWLISVSSPPSGRHTPDCFLWQMEIQREPPPLRTGNLWFSQRGYGRI
jgi:hypothetical protein